MPTYTLRHLAICHIRGYDQSAAVAAQVADFLAKVAKDIDWQSEAYSLPKPLVARIDKVAAGWLTAHVLTGDIAEPSAFRDGKMLATGEEL